MKKISLIFRPNMTMTLNYKIHISRFRSFLICAILFRVWGDTTCHASGPDVHRPQWHSSLLAMNLRGKAPRDQYNLRTSWTETRLKWKSTRNPMDQSQRLISLREPKENTCSYQRPRQPRVIHCSNRALCRRTPLGVLLPLFRVGIWVWRNFALLKKLKHSVLHIIYYIQAYKYKCSCVISYGEVNNGGKSCRG